MKRALLLLLLTSCIAAGTYGQLVERVNAIAAKQYPANPKWRQLQTTGTLVLYQYLPTPTVSGPVQTLLPSEAKAVALEPTQLLPNYPNPFAEETKIPFVLGKPGEVSLRIYNLLGQPVAELHNGYLQANRYEFLWDARGMRPGIYFCELSTPDGVFSHKMTLNR